MACEYCELIKGKTSAEILYADEDLIVAVRETGLVPGQITIIPKEHFTILEMVPDEILKKCITIANKVGIVIFEKLGCQGTNILVQNGLGGGQKVPHFSLEVLPRREGDNLNLSWKPQQLMEEEMETTFLTLKEEGEKVVNVGKSSSKKVFPVAEKAEKIVKEEGKENYLLKSLKRIP